MVADVVAAVVVVVVVVVAAESLEKKIKQRNIFILGLREKRPCESSDESHCGNLENVIGDINSSVLSLSKLTLSVNIFV